MSKVDLRHYVVIVAQLALLCAAIHLLEIEQGGGLPRIAWLVLGGFAVHALLPHAAKAPFFLALSIGGLFAVIGLDALWLLGLGLGLFGLCHLPLNLTARALLVVLAGVGLLLLRAGHWQTEWSPRVVPILASMFMFRVILYLQEQRTPDDQTWWQRLSYFFLLPNVCFPLFPIVDYARYKRSYFARPAAQVYLKGVHWMARGVLHLLLYRVVYHWMLPASWEVTDATSLLLFIVSGYALYLRISGQFHLIVGVLCLFGWDLPETHRNYFLASSFNDYWRRVNIYWKDFIEKVVFYPVFLRVRRWKVPQPLVVAILLTFAATWLLHSYQWYWLRGHFPITLPDVLFWGILGAAVAANSVLETRRQRARRAAGEGFDLRAAVIRAVQTVAMFCFLALLWSMWSGETVGEWVQLMTMLGEGSRGLLYLAAFVGLALAGGVAAQYLGTLPAVQRWRQRTDPGRNPGATLALSLALFGFGVLPQTGGAPARLAEALEVLTHERLNEQDQLAQVRGYYETLLTRQSLVGELWRAEVEMPADWKNIAESPFHKPIAGQVGYTLHPSMEGTLKRAAFTTNRHGLRDQDYAKEKPAGTYRIALMGSSYSMGSGVADDEVYEALVEERLNREYAGGRYKRYEILNFAIGGYTHAHQVALYAQTVRTFEPDAVFLADHTSEGARVALHFSKRPNLILDHPNPVVRDIGEHAGLFRGIGEQQASAMLEPYHGALTVALFEQLARATAEDGVKLVWLYVPLTRDDLTKRDEVLVKRKQMARDAGMILLSLEDAYGGRSQADLAVAPWDEHPRPEAMQLLADGLMEELLRADEELQMGLTR